MPLLQFPHCWNIQSFEVVQHDVGQVELFCCIQCDHGVLTIQLLKLLACFTLLKKYYIYTYKTKGPAVRYIDNYNKSWTNC